MREMITSKTPWLGDIPSEWNEERCKYNFKYHKNIAKDQASNYERLALTMKGVIKRSKEDLDGLQPKDFEAYQIVNKGDLVFKLIDLAGVSTSRVGLSPYVGLVSPAYILIHADETKICKEYATYFFLSMWHRLIFNEIGNGGIRSSLNFGDLLEVSITKPPLPEQQAIVCYLDSKCAAIDEAIERHKRTIEKLEEYKHSKIASIVYSGIYGEDKQKTEEWCGYIPGSWTLPRIKFLLKERNNRSETGLEEPLSMSQKVGLVPTKELGDIPHGPSTFIGAKVVEPNDLVFNKLKAHLGVFSVSQYYGLVSPDYAVYMATEKADARYLEYVFKTPQCIGEFIKRATGVGQGLTRLYTDQLFDIKCPCPPIGEQHEMAEYLDAISAQIFEAKHKEQLIIEKLEEYRKSIIYHAVTGKIDCREAVK